MMRSTKAVPLVTLLIACSAGAQLCPGVAPWVFSDVQAVDPFCASITWLAQSEVTLGCLVVDGGHRLFCPDEPVTRKQMAAFMRRLDTAQFPTTCAAGQVLKWDGIAWTCANDATGGTGGGGTVTSVAAGTGLVASPSIITTAGTLSVATTYRLPQACTTNQVPKWVGGAWTCATDVDTNAGGTVTSLAAGTGITLTPNPITASGTIAADAGYLQRRVSASCAAGTSIRAIAADGTVTCDAQAFVQGGNAFGVTALVGTTDAQPLDIRVNGSRVMRYEPNAISPNVIGGSPANSVTAGVRGATIAGGGVPTGDTDPDFVYEAPNSVTDAYGTVGGGYQNRAGDNAGSTIDRPFATIGGGLRNIASGQNSTIGGGEFNRASGYASTVGGGQANAASEENTTVGGGYINDATGRGSTVAGGTDNTASGVASTIAGGSGNSSTMQGSTVVGGWNNTASGLYSLAAGHTSEARGDYSIALGRRAKTYSGTNNAVGSIVLADGNDFDFNIATDNRFAVRATGGVYLALDIDGTGAVTWHCYAGSGAAWSCSSDRNLKHGLVALDGREVLDKLAALPVYQWQPNGVNAHVRHYGPMAQDFHATFGLGDDETMIGMQDADGVALAAIQGLNARLNERDALLARQSGEIRDLKAELAALRDLVEHLLHGAIVPAVHR